MNSLFDYVEKNPQIGAAIITACFSFIGVFLNILINIYFRNIDYKNKNRINYIKVLENFYIPLKTNLNKIYIILLKINKDDCCNIFKEAQYLSDIKSLRENTENIININSINTEKYINDFKLFIYQEKCLKDIRLMQIIINKKDANQFAENLNGFIQNIEILFNQIKIQSYKVFSNHYLIFLFKRFIIRNKKDNI